MDTAFMKVGRESPRLVLANELQRQYGIWIPKGIQFTCPNCGQPVKPCAMSRGSFQAPHFRHEVNNELAQQCDLYARGVGGYSGFSGYQRVPLPMFIHKSSKSYNQFIVEGGFKSIDSSVLSTLVQAKAHLVMGTKRYNLDAQRFGKGLTRIPFEELSLEPLSNIQLVNSPIPFQGIWSPPEDAIRSMIFTCERDTYQGRRLRLGETVALGSRLLLLAPKREEASIQRAFGKVNHLGFAGSVIGVSKLQVFYVFLEDKGSSAKNGADYLESCGITVGNARVEPKLLWPPALTGDGDVRPLYSGSSCFFEMRSEQIGCMYSCADPNTVGSAIPVELLPSSSREYKYVVLPPSDAARLLLSLSDSAEGSIYVDSCCSKAIKALTTKGEVVTVDAKEDRSLKVTATSPASVMVLRKGGSWECFDLDDTTKCFEYSLVSDGLVRVVTKLVGSQWSLVMWEQMKGREPLATIDKPTTAVVKGGHLALLSPRGKRLAMTRAAGSSRFQSFVDSKERAIIRSVSR